MAKNDRKSPRTLTGPHTLHPETGQPPAYASMIFIQRGNDPLAARADGNYIESRGASVKLAPHLHRRGSPIAA